MISWDGLSLARGQTKPFRAQAACRAQPAVSLSGSSKACAALRVRPLARLAASQAEALRNQPLRRRFVLAALCDAEPR
jgi:hypothetical protein